MVARKGRKGFHAKGAMVLYQWQGPKDKITLISKELTRRPTASRFSLYDPSGTLSTAELTPIALKPPS